MKTLSRTAVAMMVTTTIIGVLHLPVAQSWLAAAGGCPFPTAASTASPSQAEQERIRSLRAQRGAGIADRVRPLGFALEAMHKVELEKWAAENGLSCRPDRPGAGLTCTAARSVVISSSAPDLRTLMFALDRHERLVGVQVAASTASSEEAVMLYRSYCQSAARAGEPTQQLQSELGRTWSQQRTRWRRSNFAADVALTNVGDHFALYASYQAIPR